MNDKNQSLIELQHIKKMMERSTTFSSISGFSLIAAGFCAITGIWLAVTKAANWNQPNAARINLMQNPQAMELLMIAIATFLAAALSSFIFIYFRCKKMGIPVLDRSAKRVIVSMGIPLFIGCLFALRLTTTGTYQLIAPGCLLFYGLALLNAAKYTLTEIKYLGLAELIIGIINLYRLGFGLIFLAIGFGVLHIVCGIILLWKYERNDNG